MKKLFLFVMLCYTATQFASAQKNETSYSTRNNSFQLQVNNSDENTSLTVKGNVTLGADDKSIEKMSPNSSVEYHVKNQSLDIRTDDGNTLTYTINGVKKVNPDANDKALIEQCVKAMIDYGIDANNRVQRIFEKSGTAGVLNEVSRFKSDYVKEIYLSWLLKNQKLSKDEMVALLNKTDQYLHSDYYKSQLLNGVMASFLSNDATSDAYLKTVANMKSDYYQYTTINNLLKSALNGKQFDGVLSIVDHMKSDYYQSEILKSLLNHNTISDEKFSRLMKVLASMKSDYYKSVILSSLLDNKDLPKDRYSLTIAAMQGMKSDYYQSEILKKLIDPNVKDESEWSKLIQYAGNIHSDYYQSEVLMKIADEMPDSPSLKKQLSEAAKKIKSDYYYGKLARAVEK
ncbi:MAG: hypothetical protein ACTHOB_07760 [Ginsengibacter sp.]